MKFYTHVYHTKIYKVSLSAQEPKPNRNSVIRSFILGITHVPKQTPPRALTIKLNKTLILQDIRVFSDLIFLKLRATDREGKLDSTVSFSWDLLNNLERANFTLLGEKSFKMDCFKPPGT